MTIRTFTAGDDAVQVSIYNEAAADLPKFKAVTLDEVRRRLRGPDFDPTTRFFAVEDGRPVGYASFHVNGRVSFPWCRKGREQWAEPLWDAVFKTMQARGLPAAFAAYRVDWPVQRDFFLAHGFTPTREMINFVMELVDMPTPSARPTVVIEPMTAADAPAVLALGAKEFRTRDAAELERLLLHNPYFPANSVQVLRRRSKGEPVGVSIVVENPTYADPHQIDALAPCFRLGAVGTGGMQTKRVNGLFSFAAADGLSLTPIGLDLLGQATLRLHDTDVSALAAQVASDATHLLQFYQQYFRRQGSFPIYQLTLA